MERILFCTAVLLFMGVCGTLQAQNTQSEAAAGQSDSLFRAPLVDSALVGVNIFSLLESGPGAKVIVRRSLAVDAAFRVYLAKNPEKKLHGYRIRLFFDNKQNARGQSELVEKSFMKDFPSLPVYRSYTNPYFKVTAGDFRTRSEALKALRQIQTLYPKAFVVKDIINYSPLE